MILILVIIAGTGVYAVLQLRIDQITDSLKKKQPLNMLFIFSDGEKALFLEVFFYNPDTRKGSLFFVPPNNARRSGQIAPPYLAGNRLGDLMGQPLRDLESASSP